MIKGQRVRLLFSGRRYQRDLDAPRLSNLYSNPGVGWRVTSLFLTRNKKVKNVFSQNFLPNAPTLWEGNQWCDAVGMQICAFLLEIWCRTLAVAKAKGLNPPCANSKGALHQHRQMAWPTLKCCKHHCCPGRAHDICNISWLRGN